jgi:hypothetical protein
MRTLLSLSPGAKKKSCSENKGALWAILRLAAQKERNEAQFAFVATVVRRALQICLRKISRRRHVET